MTAKGRTVKYRVWATPIFNDNGCIDWRAHISRGTRQWDMPNPWLSHVWAVEGAIKHLYLGRLRADWLV